MTGRKDDDGGEHDYDNNDDDENNNDNDDKWTRLDTGIENKSTYNNIPSAYTCKSNNDNTNCINTCIRIIMMKINSLY